MSQIKNIWTGNLICEVEKMTIRELAEENKTYLEGAYLRGANLRDANLRGAYLGGANLGGANLEGAKIEFYKFPSIHLISSITLQNLPKDLQIELMHRDALGHPHPEKFDEWGKGGDCPYNNDTERFWLFEPRRELWSPGLPQMTDRDLIIEICKSQGWKIKNYL